MSDIYNLVKRYPWLPSLGKYYSNIALKNPLDFIKEVITKGDFSNLDKRVLKIFNDAFENIEQVTSYEPDETNIYIYIILRILLYILDNKRICNRVANLYSKSIYNELNKENDYNLYNIYKDLNLEVLYEEEPVIYKIKILKGQQESLKTHFKIFFIDYLRLASNLKDERRKLVNNSLRQGYVYIQSQNLNRLIQEHVRMKLLTQKNGDPVILNTLKDKLLKIQEFKEFYDKIISLWESKKEDFEYPFDISFKKGHDISDTFPPCIKEIFKKVKEGQNLIHTERLFIVWFLNALKYPEDEIVNVFSTLPDFNREKTAYQVKYAMKKGYTPYSCSSLKSYTLCMATTYKDGLCLNGYLSKKLGERKQISHPLFYVQFKQFITSRNQKLNEKSDKKNG